MVDLACSSVTVVPAPPSLEEIDLSGCKRNADLRVVRTCHSLRQMLAWHHFSAAPRRGDASPPIEHDALDPDVRNRLRALGYIQ